MRGHHRVPKTDGEKDGEVNFPTVQGTSSRKRRRKEACVTCVPPAASLSEGCLSGALSFSKLEQNKENLPFQGPNMMSSSDQDLMQGPEK